MKESTARCAEVSIQSMWSKQESLDQSPADTQCYSGTWGGGWNWAREGPPWFPSVAVTKLTKMSA